MRMLLVVTAVLVAWAGPSAALAQRGRARADEIRERIREMMRAQRIARVIELLDLDERTATRLAPILNTGYDQIGVLVRENGEARRALRDALSSPRPDPARVNGLVDRIVANRGRIFDIETRMLGESRRVLLPEQAAKLVLGLGKINRGLERQVREALRRGRPRGPGPGRGGETLDEVSPMDGEGDE